MTDEANDEEPEYLFIVQYDGDAERKRVEYFFNNQEQGRSEKPNGMVRLVSGVHHDEMYEELVSKVPPEQVESYHVEPVETSVSPETHVVEEAVSATADAVEPFVEYVLSKKKAVLKTPGQNEYEVYTKKGRAEVTYQLSERDDETKVTLRISGYQPAPEFLANFFENEIRDYAASQA